MDMRDAGTARKMIELYGNEAQSEARRRCEKALKQDDLKSFEHWAFIASLIGSQLSRRAIPPLASLH